MEAHSGSLLTSKVILGVSESYTGMQFSAMFHAASTRIESRSTTAPVQARWLPLSASSVFRGVVSEGIHTVELWPRAILASFSGSYNLLSASIQRINLKIHHRESGVLCETHLAT